MSSWNQDKPGKEAELETARYYVMSGVHVRKLTENIIRSWDMNKAKMQLKKKRSCQNWTGTTQSQMVPLKKKVLGNLERLIYISKELSGNNKNTQNDGSHNVYIKMRVKYNLEA